LNSEEKDELYDFFYRREEDSHYWERAVRDCFHEYIENKIEEFDKLKSKFLEEKHNCYQLKNEILKNERPAALHRINDEYHLFYRLEDKYYLLSQPVTPDVYNELSFESLDDYNDSVNETLIDSLMTNIIEETEIDEEIYKR